MYSACIAQIFIYKSRPCPSDNKCMALVEKALVEITDRR